MEREERRDERVREERRESEERRERERLLSYREVSLKEEEEGGGGREGEREIYKEL